MSTANVENTSDKPNVELTVATGTASGLGIVKLLLFGLAPFAVISVCQSMPTGDMGPPTAVTGLGTFLITISFFQLFFWLVPICSAFAGVLFLFAIGWPVSVVRRRSIAKLLLGAAVVSCLALVATMMFLQAEADRDVHLIQFLWGSWALLGADVYAIAILTVVLVRDGRRKAQSARDPGRN